MKWLQVLNGLNYDFKFNYLGSFCFFLKMLKKNGKV